MCSSDLTYGARSRFATYRVPGPWTAGAPVQGDATVPALNEIFKEIQGFQGAIPVTQEEYDRSKNNMILSLPSQLESSSDLAYQLDDIALYNLPLDTINREYDTLKKVSLKQMLDYAKSFLGSANFQIVVVGDKEKLMDSLKAMNFGDIVLCDRLGNPIN